MTITRTIKTTIMAAKIWNTATEEMDIASWSVSGDITSNEKALEKSVRKYEKESGNKVLKVDPVLDTGLYAMDEETFLKYAERIGDHR